MNWRVLTVLLYWLWCCFVADACTVGFFAGKWLHLSGQACISVMCGILFHFPFVFCVESFSGLRILGTEDIIQSTTNYCVDYQCHIVSKSVWHWYYTKRNCIVWLSTVLCNIKEGCTYYFKVRHPHSVLVWLLNNSRQHICFLAIFTAT
jgi:hypothetical protein